VSDERRPGAAEIAARQVESIVAAAQEAAEQLKEEARREADEIRVRGSEDAQRELERVRKQAVELDRDTRGEGERLLADARREADQLREQTRRAVEGRVASAEEAAARVLAEARTLSTGLRQLGASLSEQGERILREVQAAHRRMQADLRIGPAEESRPAQRQTSSAATAEERAAIERTARRLGVGGDRPGRGERRGPLEDLELPDWVGGEP
jgi:hypothetical protein